jgi:hypothetical protein
MVTIIFILFVVVAGVAISTNWRKKETYKDSGPTPNSDTLSTGKKEQPIKSEVYYESHCWNCKAPINSLINKKCKKCNKYFICDSCGKCLCDNKKLKRDKKPIEKSYWGEAQKIKVEYKAGYCQKCNKKLQGDTSKPLCYKCWKKMKKSYD